MLSEHIDLKSIDLRHEASRLKCAYREEKLFDSILQKDILEPVIGVHIDNGQYILFDGFKRYRAAKIVGISSLPFNSIGDNECQGIISFIRTSIIQSLNILEQAAFIKYLKEQYKLNSTELARRLEKSKSWVSMRQNLLEELTPRIKSKIFTGDFPAYAYMYCLRMFMRMNECSIDDVERFILAVSGKKLSIREIEKLAYGYFKGTQNVKDHIEKGDIIWALKKSKNLLSTSISSVNEIELSALKDLELYNHCQRRLRGYFLDRRFESKEFYAQADLLIERILEESPSFKTTLEKFYDRS